MTLTLRALLAAIVLVPALPALAEEPMPPIYPETRRDTVAEQHFGERIADPYRWLENDVRADSEVADWVERQNRVSRAYLDALPQRAWFEARLRALLSYERYGLPTKAGGRYFYTRNTGLQNQAQLFVRKGLRGQPRLLLDPNSWAKDAATALDEWKPSEDGKHLLYSVQDGGTDWRILRVLDVQTGQPLADEIRWAKFTRLDWVGSEGFLYSRFPAPEQGRDFQAANFNQAVWFHRLGTSQDQDELVYATPDRPELSHTAEVTSDGRHLVIVSARGTDARYEVRVADLSLRAKAKEQRTWKLRPLVEGFEHDWRLVDGMDRNLWFVTNWQAPRFRLVGIDLGAKKPAWRELVKETPETLEQGTIIGNKLVLNYLKDAASRALIFDLAGKGATALSLTGTGTAAGFRGRPGDPETFYSYTSFNQPTAVYRLDIATGTTRPFAKPALTFDPKEYAIDQRFFASKDGTRVPMFVVRKKAIAAAGKPVPTLLYGYGGFDVSLTPGYSSARMAWLEAGGAFVLANLRGGGEYGKDWHDAGRLARKQNVFDDFIAAGEYLIREGITPRGGLAIQGGSNGGLAGRRGGQPAARPVRRRQCPGRGDGHAAFPPLHCGPLLDRRLWRSGEGSGFQGAARLFALSQHPGGRGLSGDAGDHRRYRRPRRPRPQLQIHRRAPGGQGRRQAAPDPHRNPRRPWLGQADRQGDRGECRHSRFPGAMDGACAARALAEFRS